MLGRKRTWTSGLLAIVCLLTGSAMAATHTLTFDAVPISGCEEFWNENGLECHFTSTTDEDMTYPFCVILNPNITSGDTTGPYFGPARLVVDLTNIQMVEVVEADVYEAYDSEGTRMFLYDYEGGVVDFEQTYSTGNHTLTLVPGAGTPVAWLVISAHEGAVWEVRFTGDSIVDTQESLTFGTLKALYR